MTNQTNFYVKQSVSFEEKIYINQYITIKTKKKEKNRKTEKSREKAINTNQYITIKTKKKEKGKQKKREIPPKNNKKGREIWHQRANEIWQHRANDTKAGEKLTENDRLKWLLLHYHE